MTYTALFANLLVCACPTPSFVPGTLKRLAPNQSDVVQISVKKKLGVKAGKTCTGTAIASYDGRGGNQIGFMTSNTEFSMHPLESMFCACIWNYREEQELCQMTKAFDPKEWVDLFSDAGARYFVPTTKHHYGFGLFNFSTSISKRSSVHYGPQRDIIKDVFVAAKKYQPHLCLDSNNNKNGLFDSWAGGSSKNLDTNKIPSYTGLVEVDDFITGIQLPSMRTWAENYGIGVMWCDIPATGNSATIFASEWLDTARESKRQRYIVRSMEAEWSETAARYVSRVRKAGYP
ncbi:hypothetical protein C2857_002163 [Epichloe festucae Fl1]|uniref:alpha-L-fucosidase n=1 Tax=Epichloe festucae (strain Fl1) TaxID=877507 RepID=A0A7U3SNE2_EPIFF|nr:hypothetical protein C2857_002163 [Epichloe festucae Fl1]